MKIRHLPLLRRNLGLSVLLLLAALPARADFVLDFVYGNDNPSLSANSTYITFLTGVNGTLGGTPIYVAPGAALSQSYAMDDVIANGGFHFTDATTGTTNFYISYGNSSFFSNSTSQPNPGGDSSVPRYSVVEMAGGGGDLTQINQFGGSLRIDDYKYSVSNTTPVKSTYNTLNSAQTFAKIYNNIGANVSNPVVITQNVSGTQEFMRIIGPSTGSFSTNYPTYTNYLTSLHTGNVVTTIANNYGNDNGTGMNNVINNGNGTFTVGNQTWIAHYNFNATVDASGNINFNGTVTMTGAANATGGNIVLSGLYVTIPNDANLTTALYGMTPSNSTIYGNTAGSSITINGTPSGAATWGNLDQFTVVGPVGSVHNTATETINNNMGNMAINLKVTGDFQEGLATGFVGSTGNVGNISGLGNGTFGNLSSAQWWILAEKAYTNGVQLPGSTFFNLYGSAIFGESNTTLFDGTNTTVVPGGAVYSSPYDDRFNSALLNADDKWVVSVLQDGNLAVSAAVPEPATTALVVSCATLLVALRRKRKS